MIKAYQGAASLPRDAAVTTWLHRIVVNACLDRIRASGRRPTVPLADDAPRHPGRARRRPDPQQAALRLSVHRALAELPFDQRAVLVYVDMLGYPVEEVAAILKCAGHGEVAGPRGRASAWRRGSPNSTLPPPRTPPRRDGGTVTGGGRPRRGEPPDGNRASNQERHTGRAP